MKIFLTKYFVVFLLPFFAFACKKGNSEAIIIINGDFKYAPTQVVFRQISINADEFFWDFGDGSTSNEKEISHKYQKEGIYNITLIAKKDKYKEAKATFQLRLIPYPTKLIFNKIFFDYFGDFKTDSSYIIKVNNTASIPLKISTFEPKFFSFNPSLELDVNDEPINFEIFSIKNDSSQIGNNIITSTNDKFIIFKSDYLLTDSMGIFPKEINLYFNSYNSSKIKPIWY